MLASDIITRAAEFLHDETHVRWSEAKLLAYVNMAQFALALVRPELTAEIQVLTLVSGSRQALPAGGLQLLTLTRNMGADGATPGRYVALTDRASMDQTLVTWSATGDEVTEIENYLYDARVPKEFYVYPPPDPDTNVVTVEASIAMQPGTLTAASGTLAYDDIYMSPLIHWVLYLAYSLEFDDSNSSTKGLHH